MELRTPRLLLRPWRPSDASRVLSLYSFPEVVGRLGDGTSPPMTQPEQAAAAIDRWLSSAAPSPLGNWAVDWLRPPAASGAPRVAGRLVLFPMPGEDGVTEIAWHFHPDCWGHGVATEAARAVLRHAAHGGVATVTAVTHLDNDASQAVCRRLGMTQVGVTATPYGVEMVRFEIDPSLVDLEP